MTRAERRKRSDELSSRVVRLMDALDACWSPDGATCRLSRLQSLQPEIRRLNLELDEWRKTHLGARHE